MDAVIGWVVYGLIVLGWIGLIQWWQRRQARSARGSGPPPMTERQFLVAITAKLEENLAYYEQVIDSYAPDPAPLHWVRDREATVQKLARFRAQLAALDPPVYAPGTPVGGAG